MRLLFLTDTHIRGTTPKNRKDNIQETLKNKLYEIINIIEEYNVDFILHGGDLFDRPDVSVSIVAEFASILNQIKIPIYVVSGNHDIYGHNPCTLNRTMLGLLDSLDIVNVINNSQPIFLNKNNITIQLTGQPYKYDIDNPLDKSAYIVEHKYEDVDYIIHIVHGMLLNKPFIKGVPYTLIDDIKSTKADITFSGHYHTGFGTIKTNSRYFVNPGGFMRIGNSIDELSRIPQIALIELGENIGIDLVKLKTAKKGEKVLDRKEIENKTFKNEQLFEFKQLIDTAIDFEKLEINDILLEVSNADNVSERVKKEALRRIAGAQMKDLGRDK